MNYGDLIHFDPIETVVQLRQADEADSARRRKRFEDYLAEVTKGKDVSKVRVVLE